MWGVIRIRRGHEGRVLIGKEVAKDPSFCV